MRSSWIICVDPKSNDKSPRKRKAEGDLTQSRGGNVARKAEIGVTRPPVKEQRQPPDPARGKEWPLPRGPQRERCSAGFWTNGPGMM